MNIKYKLIEYYQVYASGLHSNTVETIVNINDPSKGVSLAFGVKILNSQFELPLTIDSMSCINRSVVDGFFGLGAFSYIADSSVGRFCSVASRCSIGAFSHPTNWLSTHLFQYRDMTSSFGTTIHHGDPLICKEMRYPKTVIGNDVWIGDNAVVLKGVNIGDGAIIAAGSIVTKDVEPYSIVGGNPARLLKMRFNEQQINALLDLKWWDLSLEELSNIEFQDIDKSIEMIKVIRLVSTTK